MKIDVSCYTCSGGHEINEDSYLEGENVLAVADGLGGHAQGEVASACAIRCIQKQCCKDCDEEKILEILETVNREVYDLGSSGRTTIAVAFLENDVFRYANVGDSRVYYFRDDKVFAQSRDHSVCQAAVDMGTMCPEEIRGSQDRSKLFKALGEREALNLKKTYSPIVMRERDAFLICSDGFWEYVYEMEMIVDLLKSDCAEEWMHYMLKRQILRAENKGDNYTVICGMVQDDILSLEKQGMFRKLFHFRR